MSDNKAKIRDSLKEKIAPKNFKKNPIKGTKFTVMVSSAKGGVGKSTFAINLTFALQKLGKKARFKALLLDKNFEKENPIKFYEITDKTCRWPIGHPHESNFYFCGRTPMEKFPYCKLHVLYAFQAKNEKEEDKITEEDIPIFIEKKIKSA